MSAHYIAERILKPAYFAISHLISGRGIRKVSVIGFDSEQDTRTGRPMLFQYSVAGDESAVELQVIGEESRPLDRFMEWVHANCTHKGTEYIILGWNLQYEWTQLFGDLPGDIGAEPEYELGYTLNLAGQPKAARYTIRVANDKRYFAKIRNESTHRTITFADGMAFYVTSLDRAGKMLDLGRKIEIQTKRFTRDDLDNPTFLQYARQDAYLTRRVGENIIDLHETYDVTTCLTAPQFAAKVFRHHFLTGTVPPPDPDLEQAGLWSYHGGKNGFYLGRPMALANVYAYDITSAYPEAMRQLPDIELSAWHWTLGYEPNVHALWNIRGTYRSCRYRGLMTHGNSWHATGEVSGWVTSYELDAALALGEIDLHDAEGWIMRGPVGTGALLEYVDTFFDMKRKAKGAKREAAKLFLNSLYGKFFQKVPLGAVSLYDLDDATGEYKLSETTITDPTQEYDWQAGGLYHPPIASLITGYVRAKIHRLEHKYESIMTSTDGFFGLVPPDPDDLGGHLGGLTVERGHLRIWRERLYVFYKCATGDARSSPDRRREQRKRHERGGTHPTPKQAPADDDGHRHTRDDPYHYHCPRCSGDSDKFALHGFRGKLADLLALPLDFGKYTYTAQAMITNKLARNAYHGTRYAPGTFVDLPFTLDLSQANAPP